MGNGEATEAMSRRHSKRHHRGFTYLMLLWWVAIGGVMLAALGRQWSMEIRRQREAELIFRAEQITQALRSYQAVRINDQTGLPSRLEDLLDDQRGPRTARHLRRLWPDPITGGEWGIVRTGERISGVYSTSQRAPLSAPENIHRFDEWRFEVPAEADSPASEPAVNKPSS